MQIAKSIVIGLLAAACWLPPALHAQESGGGGERDLANKVMAFIDDLNQLTADATVKIRPSEANLESGSYLRLLNSQITSLNYRFQSVEFRWKAFTRFKQDDIANSEFLMELVSRVEQLAQDTQDTLAALQRKCDAIGGFIEAEQFISSQDTIYKILYKKALGLSLAKQTAPQLEKVKAEEKTLFEKIESLYGQTKEAAQLLPQLESRSAALDERYYSLKALSGKIQAMEYKPPLERAKDWLLSLACVAMILIFASMAASKIKAAKKARETLKQQQELLKRANNENEYPTI